MKKISLTFAILCASCALTLAGPEMYSGKEMQQVAPPPPECPNWTGFYIGGFGGYKFGSSDIDLHLTGDWTDPFFDEDVRTLESRTPDLDTSGAEAGGLLGYNYQWNKWVFGAEAAGGYLWLRDSEVTNRFSLNSTENVYHLSTSLKTHYLVTVGPRIGYAFCRWLPYITGGLAIGDMDFDQRITEHDEFFRQGTSDSATKVGWMVGGGLQYAITNHISARVQYQYVDLGDENFGHHSTDPGFTGHTNVELREHNASFALIYQF